jgi:hypothetical protein
MKTFWGTLIMTLTTLLGSAFAATPEPSYTLVKRDGVFELRDYTAQLAADVSLTGEGATTNAAFRILANYIFKEYPSGPIGMTAPVTVQQTQPIGMTAPVTLAEGENRVFMRFFLPERYTSTTLPKPEDTRIAIVALPARRVAVVRFNWWLNEASIAEQEGKLRTWLASQNLKPTGRREVQGYNPPWTLPWWRRNEVWLPVAKN